MPYEFFIGKIFSKKVTSWDSKNVSICTSGISDLITKNHAYTDQHIKYVRHDLRAVTVCDLWFLDDDDRMKTAISLRGFGPDFRGLFTHTSCDRFPANL
jgi:hypothetical protein